MTEPKRHKRQISWTRSRTRNFGLNTPAPGIILIPFDHAHLCWYSHGLVLLARPPVQGYIFSGLRLHTADKKTMFTTCSIYMNCGSRTRFADVNFNLFLSITSLVRLRHIHLLTNISTNPIFYSTFCARSVFAMRRTFKLWLVSVIHSGCT